MKNRCAWVPADNQLYIDYHDKEWGNPVHEDRKHFEFLILESAQAGLSWLTILKRREGYRQAFADFDPHVVADFSEENYCSLLQNSSIIRNRLKIKSAINNAKYFLAIQKEFGSFDKYIWQFVGNKTIDHKLSSVKDTPIFTKEAVTLSADLNKRGFKFLGPTIIYSHMQACGLVNDHTLDCFRYQEAVSKSSPKSQ